MSDSPWPEVRAEGGEAGLQTDERRHDLSYGRGMLTLPPIAAAPDDLRTTLTALLESGTDTNPALRALLSDYTTYHRVLVIVGGLFLVAVTVLTVVCWGRFRRSRPSSGRRWTFERTTYLLFGVLGATVALFLALVVAANVSNVLDPRHGFAGALGLLGSPKPGIVGCGAAAGVRGVAAVGSRCRSARGWTAAIEDRLAWQRPKAIICSVLLVGFVVLTGGRCGARSCAESRAPGPDAAGSASCCLLVGGVLSVGVCLLMMLMVLGQHPGVVGAAVVDAVLRLRQRPPGYRGAGAG